MMDLHYLYRWLPDLYDEMPMIGQSFESRLGHTYEVLNRQVKWPVGIRPYRPGIAPRLGFVELMQVISGYFDERHLKAVAPNLTYDYGLPHAYGIKIAQQVPNVVQQLKDNPESRRAIIYIGKPEDGYETEKPCIQSIQFTIRGGWMDATVFIRSWDMLSGMPYDVVVLGGLTDMMANLVGAQASKVVANATSFHLYTDMYDGQRQAFSHIYEANRNPLKHNLFRLPALPTFEQYREWAIDQLNGDLLFKEILL